MKTLRYRVGGSVKPGILDGENKIRDAIMNDEDPQQAYLRYRKF